MAQALTVLPDAGMHLHITYRTTVYSHYTIRTRHTVTDTLSVLCLLVDSLCRLEVEALKDVCSVCSGLLLRFVHGASTCGTSNLRSGLSLCSVFSRLP